MSTTSRWWLTVCLVEAYGSPPVNLPSVGAPGDAIYRSESGPDAVSDFFRAQIDHGLSVEALEVGGIATIAGLRDWTGPPP